MATQSKCKERWEQLKKETLEAIGAIDSDTPWSDDEPEWWLEMNNARRILNGLKPLCLKGE